METTIAPDRAPRFAVIHDDGGVLPWQAAAVAHLCAQGADFALRLPRAAPQGPPGLAARALQIAAGTPRGPRRQVPEGWATVPAAIDDAALCGADLDFVLSFAATPVADDLLDAVTHGVWTMAHDEDARRTGRPPAFWEVFRGDPVTEVALVRLRHRHEPAEVLARSVLKTSGSFEGNLAEVERECAQLPARAYRLLTARGTEPARSRAPATEGAPSADQLAAFATRRAVNQASALWSRATVQEDWGIGIVDAPIASFLADPSAHRSIRWLPHPRPGDCYTDPFGLVHESRTWLFFEHFDRDLGRGVIAGCELLPSGEITPPEQVMVPPHHTSYPYVFVHEGAVYCVPETGKAGEIALYRAEGLPGPWRRVCALVEGFPGFDASLLQVDGHWWMWAGRSIPGIDRGPISALHLFHAPSLEGPWKPHRQNPVKVDVGSARPGGTPFVSKGKVYRPVQDGSITYGGRIVIAEVLRMTPDVYEERIVAAVEPDRDGPYPLGLHTLSAFGERTILDGKSSRPIGIHDLRRRARRIASRLHLR